MAALRLRLQKEMFDVTEEQLLALAHVTNAQEQEKRKKRELSLCVVRTRDVPVYVKLVLVKRTEKDLYKRKAEWQLRDLRVVDGLAADSAELRLELEERMTWLAASLEEKEAFLKVVQQMCERYNVGRKTKFVNMRAHQAEVGEVGSARGQGEVAEVAEEEEAAYQAISAKETEDLRALMQGCDTAVTAADQFSARLTAELSVLDGANIHSMMASEEAVDHLMDLLTDAITEAEGLEGRLNQYDDLLEHIRDSMEKMEGKTESLETVNENNGSLCGELDSLVAKLQVSQDHQLILQEADFSNPDDLDRVVEAAWALAHAMLAPIPYNLTRLAAVQEQRKRMDRWKERFSKGLCRHFNNVFISLGNEGGEGLGHRDLHLPLRTRLHQELLPYSRLMHWLKQVEPKSYQQLQTTYTASLEKLYQRDLDRFFEDAFVRVNGSGASVVASQDLRGKAGKGGVAGGTRLLGSDRWPELDKETVQERLNFDLVTRKLLACLEPVVMAEQEFCVAFFKMDSKLGEERPGGRVVAARTKKQVTEEVRGMMSHLFGAPASNTGVEPLLVGPSHPITSSHYLPISGFLTPSPNHFLTTSPPHFLTSSPTGLGEVPLSLRDAGRLLLHAVLRQALHRRPLRPGHGLVPGDHPRLGPRALQEELRQGDAAADAEYRGGQAAQAQGEVRDPGVRRQLPGVRRHHRGDLQGLRQEV